MADVAGNYATHPYTYTIADLPAELLAMAISYLAMKEVSPVRDILVPENILDTVNNYLVVRGEQRRCKTDKVVGGSVQIIYKGGVLHSESEPAYKERTFHIRVSIWYYKGKIHRPGGKPAKISTNAYCGVLHEYWEHGVRHRIDGPAIIGGYLKTEYCVRGVFYEEPKRPLQPEWWLTTPVRYNSEQEYMASQ